MRQRFECPANRYVFRSRLNCWGQQLETADDQAVNSRLLVRRQKMHGSQRCCGELAELTVDDIWQISGVGDQQLQRLAHSSRRDTLELGAEDNDGLSQPAQIIVHQPRQTTLIFPGPSDQTCCSILNMLQLVRDLLRRERQNIVTVVNARCDKGVD